MITRLLRLLALTLALFALHAQAKNLEPIGNFDNLSAIAGSGQPATVQQITQALTTAGSARGWQVVQSQPGQLVATINVRGKHIVTIDVIVTPGMFSVKHKSSVNMNFDGAQINPHYNKWVQILAEDTRKELAKK